MSELNDLINKLCPDGVPYKKLGDIVDILDSKRKPVKRGSRVSGKYPYYGANGVQDYINDYLFDGEFLLVGEDGSVITDKGTPILNWANGKIWVNNHAHVLQEKANKQYMLRYIKYALECKNIAMLIHGAIPKLNQQTLKSIEIPVPPLPVQSEIVRILDAFTELEAELEAELADRIEQYVYYRDYLLDKKNLEAMDGKPVETKRLDEVFNLKNGYTPSKNNAEYWKNGDVNWFRMDDIRTNGRILNDSIQKVSMDGIKGGKLFEADSLIVSTSATIGEHALITVPFMCNQRFACLTRKPDYKPLLDMKFMFYYASKLDKYCLKNINQGGFASVSMPAFKEFPIPLPSLATQERIVDILDRFDTLTTSLTDGIPAEIAMRREQYEYCRSRILDFPRLPDDAVSDDE